MRAVAIRRKPRRAAVHVVVTGGKEEGRQPPSAGVGDQRARHGQRQPLPARRRQGPDADDLAHHPHPLVLAGTAHVRALDCGDDDGESRPDAGDQ